MMAELSSFYPWSPDRFKTMPAREFVEWYETATEVIKHRGKAGML